MNITYKKLTITAKDESDSFEVYCMAESYIKRRDEIYMWIKKLAASIDLKDYTVDADDASWTMATIQPDKLFETHYPG
ncbi:MAG: hypothetical protein JST84_26860 [Acidobacteria bacterium]|nr:hypothetical protein [Acidobacteriota bacterium]